jgi:hypothetical protein
LSGSERTCLPVAEKNALHNAGATTATGFAGPPRQSASSSGWALADCGNEKHVTERDDGGVGRDEGGDERLDEHGELPSA